MVARKPNINISEMTLTWEQIQSSVPITGIDAIAKYCEVDVARVSEWIGSQVFPCWWEVATLSHCARSGDLDEWIKNGFRPTPRKSFQKEISSDIIFTFKEYEVGKNCMAMTSFRIPLVWKPMIDDILKNFLQFEGKMSNFVRCALFNLINDLTTLMEMNGHESSPESKLIMMSSQLAEKHTLNTKVLSGVKNTYALMCKTKNTEEIKKFVGVFEEEVKLLSPPWDKKANKYLRLMQELLKDVERMKRSEDPLDDEDEDIFDEDEAYPE